MFPVHAALVLETGSHYLVLAGRELTKTRLTFMQSVTGFHLTELEAVNTQVLGLLI